MRLELSTWNGNAINDGTNYTAVISPGNAAPSATANFIDIGQGDAVLAGKTLDGGYFTFHIILRGSIETQRDTINGWFSPKDFTLRKLVALDKDNSDKDWYLEGYPVTPPLLADGTTAKYSVTLALSSPYWIENDLNTDTWNIAASGETKAFTAVGNMGALPTFEITPASSKGGGNPYKYYVPIYNPPGNTYSKCFFDLTGGGWDTAALVSASKMQATGADIRVISTGNSVQNSEYWLSDINTDHTKVWAWVTCPPTPFRMTISANIANSGTVASITGVLTGTLGSVPTNGTIVIDNELFTYSAFSTVTNTFTITTRAAKGSSMAAHTTADSIYLIPSDIWITYGDLAAVAPIPYNDPLPITLSTSTNTSWVWENKFSRSGWPVGVSGPGKLGDYRDPGGYTGTHVTDASPPTVMGIIATSYVIGNVIVNSPSGGGLWTFYIPMGLTHFSAVGEKYRNGANWPATTLFEFSYSSATGKVRTHANELIATPSTVDTWEAISTGTINLGGSATTQIYFFMYGGLGTTAPRPVAYVEISEMTWTLSSTGVFHVISGTSTEVENYELAPTIRNTTLSQSIILDVTADVGNKITIDTENQLIYSADGKRVRNMLTIDTSRDEWMQFQTGSNTISFTDAGSGAVTFVTKWRGRNTI